MVRLAYHAQEKGNAEALFPIALLLAYPKGLLADRGRGGGSEVYAAMSSPSESGRRRRPYKGERLPWRKQNKIKKKARRFNLCRARGGPAALWRHQPRVKLTGRQAPIREKRMRLGPVEARKKKRPLPRSGRCQ